MKNQKKDTWWEVIVPDIWHGLTVEKLLREYYQLPKKSVHQLRMAKGVKVNGEQVRWNTSIQSGDTVAIEIFTPESHEIALDFGHLDIAYEDEHLLIVEKPKNMETHPNESGQKGTLLNVVAGYFAKQNIPYQPRAIHRLDRDTTGAVLFAKHSIAGVIMDKLLAERKIKRTYLALVHGIVANDTGVINQPIGRDRHHPTRRRVSKGGQKAITYFSVVERREQTTLISLVLETGRNHQIRVHMSHLGYPIVGDVLYGGKKQAGHTNQALHAYQIEMLHPMTREKLVVTCKGGIV